MTHDKAAIVALMGLCVVGLVVCISGLTRDWLRERRRRNNWH